MKKFLGLILITFLTTLSVYSADMRFIQVDSALFNSKNIKSFENLINKINSEKNVKFVIFTGNNINSPNKNELKIFLKKANKLNAPYYIVLGQKDVNLKKNLGKTEYIKTVRKSNHTHFFIKSPNYIFNKNDIIFMVADGSKEVIPSSIGYYKEDVMLWLDENLEKYQNKNVIIIQHYPIIPPIQKETHYTYKADEYLQLLSKHKNVKAIIAGHFNTNSEILANGVLHITTQNAPKYRIIDLLDYETANPTFWSTIKE